MKPRYQEQPRRPRAAARPRRHRDVPDDFYWSSREEIRAYAGEDIEKPHHLPRDAEYLLELPESVQHFDILVDEE